MISEQFQKFIHPINNKNVDLSKLYDGSHKIIWWVGKCGHEFKKDVRSFCIKNKGCPFCSKRATALKGFNDLGTKNPEVAEEWHPSKNGDLTPEMVTTGSRKKVWWLCGKCKNEWPATIHTRTYKDPRPGKKGKSGCPFCSGRQATKERSFAVKSSQYLYLWHPTKNLPLTPYDFSFKSNKKVWWLCPCGEEWNAVISGVTRGCDCPKCWLIKSRKTCQTKYGANNPMQNLQFATKNVKSSNKSTILYHWKTNDELVCKGTYEIAVINYLNENLIDYTWQNIIIIPYDVPDIGGLVYLNDLYLLEQDKYIEVKGWLDRNPVTKAKWLWFHATHPNSELWDKAKLKSLGLKVR